MASRFISRMFYEEDNAPLIVIRIVFGLLIFLESIGALLNGWVYNTLIAPPFTFTFIGLEWLQPLSGPWMYVNFALMGIAALMVMLGYWYKSGVAIFTILWSIAYWLQKSEYNNHYYLLILLCLIMLVIPANRYFSLDAKLDPGYRKLSSPAWCRLVFIVQLFIVYTFAGLAKVNSDWLDGEPITTWIAAKSYFPVIGPLYETQVLQWGVVIGGVVFDLLIVPFLLWRKTRKAAFWVSVGFHLFNSITFHIGIFPYLMIGLNVVFFPPDKVRKWFFAKWKSPIELPAKPVHRRFNWLVLVLGGIYFIVQIWLPLRHHFYKGPVSWTEEGHRMAWRMMLRSKHGDIYYRIKDPDSSKSWYHDPKDTLSTKQYNTLATHPDMIWQYAQQLDKQFREHKNVKDPEVYAFAQSNLNYGSYKMLVDSEVDLSSVPWQRFSHSEWITEAPD